MKKNALKLALITSLPIGLTAFFGINFLFTDMNGVTMLTPGIVTALKWLSVFGIWLMSVWVSFKLFYPV